MADLRLHDVVRVRALPASADSGSACAPGLGDRGAVVHVLEATGGDRYVVEAGDSLGQTLWLAEFAAHQLEATARRPREWLTFSAMASGERCVLLARDVSWRSFADYARSVVARLDARVIDIAEGPDQCLWTLSIAAQRYWLCREDHGGEVTLEPCDAAAGAAIDEVRQALRKSRPPIDVEFRLIETEDELPCLDSGEVDLDRFIRDELGWGGDVAEDSLALEIARQIQDVRAGRVGDARNGGDAICITISPTAVWLEYAIPGAPRPGTPIEMHGFVDVFVRWFERVNPPLGQSIRAVVWPRAFA